MIRALDLRLRERSRVRLPVVVLSGINDGNIAHIRSRLGNTSIPTTVCPQTLIPSFTSDSIAVHISSRPVCTSQPYWRPGSDCAHAERQSSARKLRSGVRGSPFANCSRMTCRTPPCNRPSSGPSTSCPLDTAKRADFSNGRQFVCLV